MCVDIWDAAEKVLDAAAGDTEDMLNNILENIEVVLNVCFRIGNLNLIVRMLLHFYWSIVLLSYAEKYCFCSSEHTTPVLPVQCLHQVEAGQHRGGLQCCRW